MIGPGLDKTKEEGPVMRKAVWGLLGLAAVLSGCANMDKWAGVPVSEGNGYEIQQTEKSKRWGRATVEYVPYEMLRAREAEAAKLAMREPEETPFKNGYIVVRIDAPTLETAKSKFLEIIVAKDGEVLQRAKGADKVPMPPHRNTWDMWWSTTLVGLKSPIEDYVDVVVVDPVANYRDAFRISSPAQ